MPSSVEEDDLVSYGIFGLFDAIEKFDPSLGWKFSTYARVRIRGAIIDGMRQSDWVPRSVKVRPHLIYVDGIEDGEEIVLGDPFTMFDAEEIKQILRHVIDTLPERERQVLSLYYYDDLLLREVGDKFDRSEAWASKIHARGLRLLRAEIVNN
jgi:RNA polymerase sigma factor for flagellar operon FliA